MSQKNKLEYLRVGKASVITGVLLAFILIMTMPVWGSTEHVHNGVSPFEKKGKYNLHCLLNKHNHPNQICPHALLLVQRNKEGFFINAECGGNPEGPVPVNNIFNLNPAIFISYIYQSPLNFSKVMPGAISLHSFYLPKPLDHPPKKV